MKTIITVPLTRCLTRARRSSKSRTPQNLGFSIWLQVFRARGSHLPTEVHPKARRVDEPKTPLAHYVRVPSANGPNNTWHARSAGRRTDEPRANDELRTSAYGYTCERRARTMLRLLYRYRARASCACPCRSSVRPSISPGSVRVYARVYVQSVQSKCESACGRGYRRGAALSCAVRARRPLSKCPKLL